MTKGGEQTDGATARYPGAPLDLSRDPRGRALRDAERCHILPLKRGVRVMTQGVFDILHLGHLHYFQAARALGDELVVIIARDETVTKNKHAPIFSEEARREMVGALEPVDYAVLGHRGDFYRVVEELQPDIICIGYDQPYDAEAIETECARRGIPLKVVRLQHMDYDLDSTRKVVEVIAQKLARHELYTKATAVERAQKRLEEVGAVETATETPAPAPARPVAAGAKTSGHAADKVNRPRPRRDERGPEDGEDGETAESTADKGREEAAR